ncbi:MAG: protein kinase [Pseudomonadota bacterium]
MFIPFQLGRYTVTDRVRVGGMSEVLEGRFVDEEGDLARIAIKRPLPEASPEPRLMMMFWEECALMERVRHPAFPRFIESGMAGGQPYLAMELLQGRRVRDMLNARPEGTLGANAATWVLVAAEIADAAHSLHCLRGDGDRAILHGDINPSNVMIDMEGRVRLLDLGIAAGIARGINEVLPGHRLYHPPYLALDAEHPGVDLDTYAIARVLVECLAGQDASVAMTRGLPETLVTILSNALDPGGMFVYKNASQLALELRSFIREDRVPEMRSELQKLALA